jgi:hypothetical protein
MQLNAKLTTPAAGCEDRMIQGAASPGQYNSTYDIFRPAQPPLHRHCTGQTGF